jgi:DNA-binding MarR family transcriptional regulator
MAKKPAPASQPSKDHGNPLWHSIPTALARRLHQLCAARTSEVVSKADLTPLQYGVLVHLSMLSGQPGIEQNVLADRLNVDRNTASVLTEQLVKKGLVDRQVNGEDRRSRLLSLTVKGEKLYAQLRPAHFAANESVLAPLTARERKLLIALLIRVIEGNLPRPEHGSRRGNQD